VKLSQENKIKFNTREEQKRKVQNRQSLNPERKFDSQSLRAPSMKSFLSESF